MFIYLLVFIYIHIVLERNWERKSSCTLNILMWQKWKYKINKFVRFTLKDKRYDYVNDQSVQKDFFLNITLKMLSITEREGGERCIHTYIHTWVEFKIDIFILVYIERQNEYQ